MSTRVLAVRPLCAQCKRAVAEFFEEEDPTFERVRFTAVCHGQRESVTLEGREASGLQFGLAFMTTPLLGGA